MSRWSSNVSTDILSWNGEPRGIEAAALERVDSFEALLNYLPVATVVVDASHRIRLLNPMARPLFGDFPDHVGRDFDEVIHSLWAKGHADEAVRVLHHTLKTGEAFNTWHATESCEWRMNRLPLTNGRLGVVCYFRDLSEPRRIRSELQEATDRHQQQMRLFDGIVSTTPDFVYVFDPQGRFLYVNKGLLDVWGMKLPDVIGRTCRELGYEQWHHDMHMREIAQVIQTRLPIKGEVPFKAPLTGIYGVYDYIFTPVFGPGGEVEFIAGITRDVTERKNAEKALQEAQEKLRQHAGDLELIVAARTAELRKSVGELEHFSYSITHDMRAPLRAMRGFSTLLLDGFCGDLPPSGQDFLKRIMISADRMDQLIVDALDYSKAVREELALAPVDPEALLRGMIESYLAFQLPAADIRIEGKFPRVLANQAGLTQCFSNLLHNAVKFVALGQQPHVRIWAESRGPMVRLWFEDNGIGIAPELQEKIFGMFQRLSRDYEGTGIGLALVRKVMERMEGEVGVESEPGRGSRFWLDLKPGDNPGE